eukprot:CAMPEP_0172631476 /NCGR_PEP_ID=MMETSP1068-20121228/179358_1 /TAXON_ID=35684 /ORGANISM="Pseudopedinella elastica, Strain CCMP716" /LENGTH=207 /DNA_ID=CAMNT_0013442625 /DNA_START=99 /DNA_END=723 /DNA_ORIENTATION=-
MAEDEAAKELENARGQKLARDQRLRAESVGQLNTNCSLMLDHLHGLVKSAQVGSRQSGAAEVSGVSQRPSEDEKLRRDAFHVAFHAEMLAAAGSSLLDQINDIRLNILMKGSKDAVEGYSSPAKKKQRVVGQATRQATAAPTDRDDCVEVEAQSLAQEGSQQKKKQANEFGAGTSWPASPSAHDKPGPSPFLEQIPSTSPARFGSVG